MSEKEVVVCGGDLMGSNVGNEVGKWDGSALVKFMRLGASGGSLAFMWEDIVLMSVRVKGFSFLISTRLARVAIISNRNYFLSL